MERLKGLNIQIFHNNRENNMAANFLANLRRKEEKLLLLLFDRSTIPRRVIEGDCKCI